MTGTFDPAQFLDQTTTEANSTTFEACPEGEYNAICGEPGVRTWQGKKDPTKSGITLTLPWEVDDAAVKEKLGRDKVVVYQDLMLDVSESGAIESGKGKNVALGRTRDALGLNQPGQPFNFRMFEGKVGKISVRHEMYKDQPMAKVTAVARIG